MVDVCLAMRNTACALVNQAMHRVAQPLFNQYLDLGHQNIYLFDAMLRRKTTQERRNRLGQVKVLLTHRYGTYRGINDAEIKLLAAWIHLMPLVVLDLAVWVQLDDEFAEELFSSISGRFLREFRLEGTTDSADAVARLLHRSH